MTQKYTPTKWIANKTVATADVMNNIEQGIVDAINISTQVRGELDSILIQGGVKGEKGDKGDKGDKGNPGENGQDGLTTQVSVNGTIYTHVNGTITLPNYPTVPTKVSQLTNDSSFATESYVTNKIAEATLSGGEVDLSGYVTKEIGNASQIMFSDGETFQAKLDAGILKGEKGDKGDKGDPGIFDSTTVFSNLKTISKTVIGAINELYDMISNGSVTPPGNEGETPSPIPPDDNNTDGITIRTNKDSYNVTIGTNYLEIPITVNGILPGYPVWEIRQNGSYFLYCYRSGNNINADVYSLSEGIYDNLTIVVKENSSGNYVDVATSNTFSITVTSGSGSDGGGSSSGGSNGNTNTNLLVLNMQHASSHNCVPNFPGETCDWKYKPRMGHGITIPNSYQDGQPWKAFGQWLTVYKENGKQLVENVGVELTDFKMWRYNESTNQWVLVNDTFDYGSFYLEDFWDDGNAPLNSNKILSSDKKTYKCLMNSATNGRCFHPFSAQKNWSDFGFSGSPSYVVSQVKFRLIKWDESGVDNRANANLCVNAGGDYWIYKGASFDSQWRHNGDFAIGNFIKATSEWQYAYATSCPPSWDKGFPVDTI